MDSSNQLSGTFQGSRSQMGWFVDHLEDSNARQGYHEQMRARVDYRRASDALVSLDVV